MLPCTDKALLLFRQQIGDDGTVTKRRLNPIRPIAREVLPLWPMGSICCARYIWGAAAVPSPIPSHAA
jgi:hypothetical protein